MQLFTIFDVTLNTHKSEQKKTLKAGNVYEVDLQLGPD